MLQLRDTSPGSDLFYKLQDITRRIVFACPINICPVYSPVLWRLATITSQRYYRLHQSVIIPQEIQINDRSTNSRRFLVARSVRQSLAECSTPAQKRTAVAVYRRVVALIQNRQAHSQSLNCFAPLELSRRSRSLASLSTGRCLLIGPSRVIVPHAPSQPSASHSFTCCLSPQLQAPTRQFPSSSS